MRPARVTSAEGAQPRLGPSVVAVIPAFNEAKTIAEVVTRTLGLVARVIVVDDGSSDGTLDCVQDLGVQAIRHDRNRGKGESLLTGIQAAEEAGYDYVVTLDADGQHPPECIPQLVALADPRIIVLGSRTASKDAIPMVRYCANQTANFFISWAAGHWVSDTQCGFRVYPVGLFREVRLRRRRASGFVLESEVLIEACRAGYRVKAVPVPALYASVLKRPSRFRPVRDTAATTAMVTWKILTWGLFPIGLLRAQRERLLISQPDHP